METSAVAIDPTVFTLIIQFEVDASSGEAFARELSEAVGKSLVKLAGFRASVFQLSSDHTRVIRYRGARSLALTYFRVRRTRHVFIIRRRMRPGSTEAGSALPYLAMMLAS